MESDRHLYIRAFVSELPRSGVFHACLCPGSRSTPLAMLLRREPDIRVWTLVDERSAAFFALGMAKASRRPVAVISTSGTAAVNFAPAVVEAHAARVPLLVLTADRPPELRAVGASQTIDQLKLFGEYVKWFIDLTMPEASPDAVRYARAMACRAVAVARGEAAGPVHINFPFREPLVPAPLMGDSTIRPLRNTRDGGTGSVSSPGGAAYLDVRHPQHRIRTPDIEPLALTLEVARRGLIVCGPQDDPDFPAAVTTLARRLGFPLLADPLSLVRCGVHHEPLIIDSYDAFLRDDATADTLEPELVIRFGAAPVSKPLLAYLERHGTCRQILVDAGLGQGPRGWSDPSLVAAEALACEPAVFCDAVLSALPGNGPPHAKTEQPPTTLWLARWIETARVARQALHDGLAAEPRLSEPRVFSELAHLLPAGVTVFAGNSMPIRDLDAFFPGGPRPLRFLANRGASGIDGVVSSALGVSAAGFGPLLLIVGDLSFYHDMNGLLAARRHHLRATVVLINNDGGGIFSLLPQAEDPEHFEELFGSPHGLDFGCAATLYGIGHHMVADWEDFRVSTRRAIDGPGVNLIEVRTDRSENARLHRDLTRVVTQSLHEHLGGQGRP